MNGHILHLKHDFMSDFMYRSTQGDMSSKIHADKYTRVWSGSVADNSTAEDLFSLFNFIDENDDSKTYIADMRSISVGDIIVIGSVWHLIVQYGYYKLTADDILDKGFSGLLK